MALSPYPRRVARIALPEVLRWPDIPIGALRQVAIDASKWADQVEDDPPTSITASVSPDDDGLDIAGAAVDGNVGGLTLTAVTAGDYAVTLTFTTAAGRVEPYTARILVTAPAA
jgi:hypothetical protein